MTEIRRWPESEIETLTSMPKVEEFTPPAPVKRQTMEKEPVVKRPPTRSEVEAIEDQILRMAFKKAMKTVKRRTLVFTFLAGVIVGAVGLAAALIVMLDKAGAP